MRAPKILPVLLLGSVFILTACRSPFQPGAAPKPSSKLILSIAGDGTAKKAARTIVPDVSNLIAKYSVQLQKGTVSQTVTSATSPIDVDGLEAGTWTVTVSGLDASDNLLAQTQGGTSANVSADHTASVSVTLIFIQDAGSGGIDITLCYPPSIGIDGVDATLGGSAISPAPAIDASDPAATKVRISQAKVAAGSPILHVFLKKGGTVLAGVTESLWVFQNVTTKATIRLNASDFGSPPVTPTGFALSGQHDGTLLLAWSDVTDIADAYVVRRSGAAAGPFVQSGSDLAFDATGFTDSGLTAGTTYYYQVTAKNRFGESQPASGNAATFTAAAAPTFSPAPGPTFLESQVVSLSSATVGASIFYTIDGSVPSASSIPYAASIPLTGHGSNLSIKAIAVMAGMADSAPATAGFSINRKPVITGFAASAASLYRSESATLTASAYDPEGGALSYAYSSTPGLTIAGSGAGVTATAIGVGTQIVTATVSDSQGNQSTTTVSLLVKNRPPILSLSAPLSLIPIWNSGSDQVALSFSAIDPEGDAIDSYSYTVVSGPTTGSVIGSGDGAVYTSGSSAGMCVVRATVTDHQGGATSLDVPIKVCGWRKLASQGVSPAPRTAPTAVYDGNGTVYLFGGNIPGADYTNSATWFNDLWKYNIPTQTWTKLGDNQPATASYPAARTMHSAIYDGASGDMILYGGWASSSESGFDNYYSDLWKYKPDTNTWSKALNNASSFPVFGICPVSDGYGHMLFIRSYDWATPSLFRLTISDSNWVWNGTSVSLTVPIPNAISKSFFYSAAYFITPIVVGGNVQDQMLVFGGQNASTNPTTYYNSVYKVTTLTGSSMTCTASVITPVGTPPSNRAGASSIMDSNNNLVIFGGTNGVRMNDVWKFNPAAMSKTWTKLNSFTPPSARCYHKAIYYNDGVLGDTMLIFGTQDPSDSEVWQYVFP